MHELSALCHVSAVADISSTLWQGVWAFAAVLGARACFGWKGAVCAEARIGKVSSPSTSVQFGARS